ncbi:hypothetical protein CSKR_102623 [Clonorchis sinensis]|uniref:Uncharacterized protein n=1 Tax=Clonorchis sinensis TaxID=79923 RepID=A0A419PJY2_CLOSI|nr:hypothetical protein CSKR_102623 [Clonorchis sinensis]
MSWTSNWYCTVPVGRPTGTVQYQLDVQLVLYSTSWTSNWYCTVPVGRPTGTVQYQLDVQLVLYSTRKTRDKFFRLWFMALPDTKLDRGKSNRSQQQRTEASSSEPPEMIDAPVLLEGWRVYKRTMVQRNRATLPAGRTRPPHKIFIPRACRQMYKVENHPSSHKCGLCIINFSGRGESKASKTAQSIRTSKQHTNAGKGKSRRRSEMTAANGTVGMEW